MANPNHPQATADGECDACMSSDQSYWPCDVDGLCYCRDVSRPKIPPAPSTRSYNGGGGLEVSDEGPCESIFPVGVFETLAPQAAFPYTYGGFCDAVRDYNANHIDEGIFVMGSEAQRKSELAAFLGNALHESDEFRAGREYLMCADPIEAGGEVYCRPCDSSSFDWDNMTCPPHGSLASEGRPFNGYCQSNLLPPGGCECDDVYERSPNGTMAGYVRADSLYLGRGSIQLSWNYNYIRASVALTGAPQTFCQRPDLVATNEGYAWGAGLFYWMENSKNDRTCHQSILLDDDFGGTLDNINGGLECPADEYGWHGKAVQLRLNRYCRAATAIGIDRLGGLGGCIDMDERMRQCLDEGTCKDCEVWEETLSLLESESEGGGGGGGEDGASSDAAAEAGGGGRAKATKAPTKQGASSATAADEGADEGGGGEGGGGGGGRAKSSKRPEEAGDDAPAEEEEQQGESAASPPPHPPPPGGEDADTDPPTTPPPSDAEADTPSTPSPSEAEADTPSTPAPSEVEADTPSTPSPSEAEADTPSTPSPSEAEADPPTPAPVGGNGAIQGHRTRRPSSSTASPPTASIASTNAAFDGGGDDLPLPSSPSSSSSSEASQFSGVAAHEEAAASSSELPPAAPSSSTSSHANQFAMTMHSKEGTRDDDPASSIVAAASAAVRPTTEEFSRPTDVAEEDTVVVDGPDAGPPSGADMTNWANTPLHRPPTITASSTSDEPTTLMPTFAQTNSPVLITNFAEAFLGHSPGAGRADEGSHGEDAFADETDVLRSNPVDVGATSNDGGMATGTDDDDPPQLTESYATASYVTDVEDGPQTLDDVPILTPDVDSDESDSHESGPLGAVCPGDVLACPDGSVVSREIRDGGCNFAPCPDWAYPVGTAGGHFFPVWGSGGNVACVDGAPPPSWASGAYLKGTKSDCCEAYSMLRVKECLAA